MKGISSPPFELNVKVGSFTRDTSLASGNQAITGIGFKPKAIIFLAVESQTREASWGFCEGSNVDGFFDRGAYTADTYGAIGSDACILVVETSAPASYNGTLNSLDDDGFTITWLKSGSPTGTLTVKYLAIG